MSYTDNIYINDALNFAKVKKLDNRYNACRFGKFTQQVTLSMPNSYPLGLSGARFDFRDKVIDVLGNNFAHIWYTREWRPDHAERDWAYETTHSSKHIVKLYFKEEDGFEKLLFMLKMGA